MGSRAPDDPVVGECGGTPGAAGRLLADAGSQDDAGDDQRHAGELEGSRPLALGEPPGDGDDRIGGADGRDDAHGADGEPLVQARDRRDAGETGDRAGDQDGATRVAGARERGGERGSRHAAGDHARDDAAEREAARAQTADEVGEAPAKAGQEGEKDRHRGPLPRSGSPDGLPGPLAALAVPGDPAVDDHRGDALRVVMGIAEGGPVGDGCRVEQDEVGDGVSRRSCRDPTGRKRRREGPSSCGPRSRARADRRRVRSGRARAGRCRSCGGATVCPRGALGVTRPCRPRRRGCRGAQGWRARRPPAWCDRARPRQGRRRAGPRRDRPGRRRARRRRSLCHGRRGRGPWPRARCSPSLSPRPSSPSRARLLRWRARAGPGCRDRRPSRRGGRRAPMRAGSWRGRSPRRCTGTGHRSRRSRRAGRAARRRGPRLAGPPA